MPLPLNRTRLAWSMFIFASLIVAATLLTYGTMFSRRADRRALTPQGAIPVGIIGDSDSHAYHDTLWFPEGSPVRGGAYRASTYNWPEILAILRGAKLDLGEWDTWGVPHALGYALDKVGIPVRVPRKRDYRYNFAYSGAGCHSLMHGAMRQAPRLVELMNQMGDYWRNGIVVIRIGINDFGNKEIMERLASNAEAPELVAKIDECAREIRSAVSLIQQNHPGTAIVLVGIFNNAHWAKYLGEWHSAQQLGNLDRAYDRFDDALKQIASERERVAFVSDREWFSSIWGTRDAHGEPAYRVVTLSNGLTVKNTSGDEPTNAVVADGHAGTIFNAFWARHLIETLNSRFGLTIEPLADSEIEGLLSRANAAEESLAGRRTLLSR